MKREARSRLRDILLQLTVLKKDLETIHWEVGEEIPIEKSFAIRQAAAGITDAIKKMTEVIA